MSRALYMIFYLTRQFFRNLKPQKKFKQKFIDYANDNKNFKYFVFF